MQRQTQVGDESTVWFDGALTEPSPETVDCPAGYAWINGQRYALPAYAPEVGAGRFTLYLEPVAAGADYYLDLTGLGTPAPWPVAGVLRVAWRDAPGGPIIGLRSVRAGAA